VDERLRQADALKHALRKALQALAPMGREPDEIEKIRHSVVQLSGAHAAETTMKFEKFGCREPLIEAEIFRQESNFAADFHVAGRRAENKSFSAAWAHQP